MDKRVLEEVLFDQKEEMANLMQKDFVHRREEAFVDLESHLAQVVIGVRRSGKSILCRNVLKNAGVHFAYVNFDDERLFNLTGTDLNDVLQVLYKIYGDFKYLFIDEIQNIPEWFLFVNRLLRSDMHVLITGSNAKLLGGELATHLTGRHTQIELFPFSFLEYCDFFKIDKTSLSTKHIAFRRQAFDNFLQSGGFPELLSSPQNHTYINTLVKSILEVDIRNRYRIRYGSVLSKLANHVMNIAPSILNYNELQDLLLLKSVHTAENYVEYCKCAYLFFGLQKYSAKSKIRMTKEKLYCVDIALMNNRENSFAGENLGWRLETLVFIELLRLYHPKMMDLYYYSDRSGEVDFVVCDHNRVQTLYQVSYDISFEKTRKREILSLVNGAKKLCCNDLYLITDHEYADISKDNFLIKIRPAYDWILGN